MSSKKIINESIARNPLGLKEVFQEAIMERVALALEAKKLDKVNPDALKGDFEDREDKDIDNDGDVDDSDEYLHNRRKTIMKAMKKESVGLDEAKMSDIDILRAARRLASVGKDDKTKEFGRGLLAFHTKNGSFTPAQVSGLQNIMKNAGFQFAKESVDLSEAKKKDKPAFGSSGGFSYAVNLNGVENEFFNQPFGRQLDAMKKVKEFTSKAKKGYAGAKGKSTLAAVKDWVKLNQPTQFYAKWKSDSSSYKDDSVEIFYTKEANKSLNESHFNVGDSVKCTASGMTGKVAKVDPEEKGKYYTVKREDGKMIKYAPDELKALKEGINESKEIEKLGAEAFNSGIKRQVVMDPKMKDHIASKDKIAAMKAWYKGWDRENLKD